MATKLGTLFWEIVAKTDKFDKSLGKTTETTKDLTLETKKAEEQVSKSSSRMEKAFKALSVAGALYVGKRLVGELLKLEDSFQIQERAVNKLDSALKVTGTFTRSLSNDFQIFASQLQKTTNTADEVTLELLSTAQTMGLTADESKRAVENAIGLSNAFGIDVTSAFKASASAVQGNFDLLNRYIPTLRNTTDEAERAEIAQRTLANAFQVAQDVASDSLGVEVALQNTWGDTQEIIGGLITKAFTPLRNITNEVLTNFNEQFSSINDLDKSVSDLSLSIGTYNSLLETYEGLTDEATSAERELLQAQIERQSFLIKNDALDIFKNFSEQSATIDELTERLENQNTILDESRDAFENLSDEQKIYAQSADKATESELKLARESLKRARTFDEAGKIVLQNRIAENEANLEAVQTYNRYLNSLEDITETQTDLTDLQAGQELALQRLAQAYADGTLDLTGFANVNGDLYSQITLLASEINRAKNEVDEYGESLSDLPESPIGSGSGTDTETNIEGDEDTTPYGKILTDLEKLRLQAQEILDSGVLSQLFDVDNVLAFSNAVTSGLGGAIGNLVEDLVSGEDAWNNFGKTALLVLADVIEALGLELSARAAILFADALFTAGASIAPAIQATAGAVAAFAGAGLVRGFANKFESGGIVVGQPVKADRVPALLSAGEEVLREDDPRHSYNNGSGMQLVINLDGKTIAETVVDDYVNRGVVVIDAKRGVL